MLVEELESGLVLADGDKLLCSLEIKERVSVSIDEIEDADICIYIYMMAEGGARDKPSGHSPALHAGEEA